MEFISCVVCEVGIAEIAGIDEKGRITCFCHNCKSQYIIAGDYVTKLANDTANIFVN